MIRQEKKVLSIVNEHHYKPDYFASNVIDRHSKTIGMIVPDVTDFFFSKLIEGVESYLNPLGYVIVLCNSRHSQENEISIYKRAFPPLSGWDLAGNTKYFT